MKRGIWNFKISRSRIRRPKATTDEYEQELNYNEIVADRLRSETIDCVYIQKLGWLYTVLIVLALLWFNNAAAIKSKCRMMRNHCLFIGNYIVNLFTSVFLIISTTRRITHPGNCDDIKAAEFGVAKN